MHTHGGREGKEEGRAEGEAALPAFAIEATGNPEGCDDPSELSWVVGRDLWEM